MTARTGRPPPREQDSGLAKEAVPLVAKKESLATLTVALQPIRHLASRDVVGFEALLRGPEGAPIPVLAWFEQAAQEGWLEALAVHAWELAFEAADAFLDPDLWLYVNWDQRLPLPPAVPRPRTVIELSERRPIEPHHVAAIHGQGALAAMDDYSQGATALSVLANCPLDIIKLDRQLTFGIARHPYRQRWLGDLIALIRMARPQVALVAEGVENEPDSVVMAQLGVEYGQGFWLGRPELPALAVSRLVRPS
jgi:EAL domain-containing protein (putative c-di-GMP-specific phosphodiesterase class I)